MSVRKITDAKRTGNCPRMRRSEGRSAGGCGQARRGWNGGSYPTPLVKIETPGGAPHFSPLKIPLNMLGAERNAMMRPETSRVSLCPTQATRILWNIPGRCLIYAPCREVSGKLIGDCLRRGTSMASGPRIAASKEGVPAMFGGVVSRDLINDFATNRTKSNMNPPTAVPYITEAGT